MERRNFIQTTSLTALGLLTVNPMFSATNAPTFTSNRPPRDKRKFISEAVDAQVEQIKSAINDPELAWLFENCFPNTLDTTVTYRVQNNKPFTYVITGDIDAMWLRDSSAQVWPYLPLMKKDKPLQDMIAGVVNQQAAYVLIDPYANAFYDDPTRVSHHKDDKTDMRPGVHERKWEVDSLCYVIRLAYQYWKASGDTSPFDDTWAKAMKLIVSTFKNQQRKNDNGAYHFRRTTQYPSDTAQGNGTGNPIRPIGLICSVFRPSDDGTIFPFLVPSNFFAVASLKQLAEMANVILNDASFSKECTDLATEVYSALNKYAVVDHFEYGKVYAYEIDGYGSILHMDDANVPSLISLPYIAGVDPDSKVYQNTRKMVLSSMNPYYAQGKYEGVGGPHTGKEMIWPLSYVMRAMTSKDEEEIKYCIKMIKETHANTGFIHESFYRNDPMKFTRKWFAWANTIFGELVLKIYNERPHLLKKA